MKKILYIISDTEFTGGSRHLYNLIISIDKKKFIPVLISKPSPILEKLKSKIKVYEVTMNSRVDFGSIKKIKEIVRKEKPDIIHLHSTRAGLLGTLAVKDLGIPIIYTEHLFTSDYAPNNKFVYLLQTQTFKLLSKSITKVIAVSGAVKKYLVDKKIFPENKVGVIYNGVVLAKIKKIKAKNNNKITVGSIGTLTEIKGFKYLIEAMSKIKSKNIFLEIVGQGKDEKYLKKLIDKYNLQKNITIFTNIKDIAKKLSSWDIYIQCSLSESFGMALAEAMLQKLAIIATKVGGMPELVANTGLLIPSKNPGAIKSAIIKLADDLEFRAKIGKLASARIKKYFSQALMIKNIENFYDEKIN